jgi:hypothetical protein
VLTIIMEGRKLWHCAALAREMLPRRCRKWNREAKECNVNSYIETAVLRPSSPVTRMICITNVKLSFDWTDDDTLSLWRSAPELKPAQI